MATPDQPGEHPPVGVPAYVRAVVSISAIRGAITARAYEAKFDTERRVLADVWRALIPEFPLPPPLRGL
jgi:hypothetical protein